MSISLHPRHLCWGLCFGVSVATALFTYRAHTALSKKLMEQKAIASASAGFRDQLPPLKKTAATWNRAFRPMGSKPDILKLHEALHLEEIVPFSPDEMSVVNASQENHAGSPLPLYRICVANTVTGFTIREATVSQTITTLHTLAARRDVRLGAVLVKPDKGSLSVTAPSLCVLMRET